MNIANFVSNLSQVECWTSKLAAIFDYSYTSYGNIFRKTNPIINNDFFYKISNGYTIVNSEPKSITDFELLLSKVIEVRPIINDINSTLLNKGRILCFSPLLTTNDGIAITESKYFMDESDNPPIDTWFYLEKDFIKNQPYTLFCWIPTTFESVVNEAMNLQTIMLYTWLDEIMPVFFTELSNRLTGL